MSQGTSSREFRAAWLDRLESVLLIRPAESGLVWFLFLVLFLLGLGLGLGRGVNDALFLHRFGVDFLPLTYVLVAAGLFICGTLYMAWVDLAAPERIIQGMLATLGVAVFGIWAAISAFPEAAWPYPVLYLAYEVASDLLMVHAAGYLAQNMNLSQSNRLMAFAFSGAQFGMLSGGLILSLFSTVAPLHDMLLVWVGTCGVLILVIRHRHRRIGASPFFFPSRRRTGLNEAVGKIRQGVRFWKNSLLLFVLGMGMVFTVVSFYTLAFLVNKIYAISFATEEELGRFLGFLIAFNAASGLFIQVLLTGRLVDRWGLRAVNLVFPSALVASNLLLAVSASVPTAVIGSFTKDALMTAIRNPVYSLFFQALPQTMQGRSRAFMVGMIIPLALAVSGGLLYLLLSAQSLGPIIAIGAVASLCYLWYSIRSNAAYRDALLATLREGVFLGRSGQFAQGDRKESTELRQRLERGLDSDVGNLAISYARRLVEWFPEEGPHIVLRRWERHPTAVRIELAELLIPRIGEDISEKLWALQEEAKTTEDRCLLLRLLLEIGDAKALELAKGYAGSEDPWELGLWAWARMKEGSETAYFDAEQVALRLMNDSDSGLFRMGVALLDRLPESARQHERLLLLLAGTDPARRLPILACVSRHPPSDRSVTAEVLIHLLKDEPNHENRAAVVELLAGLGDTIQPEVWKDLFLSETHDSVRCAILGHWHRRSTTWVEELRYLLNNPDIGFRVKLTILREAGVDILSRQELEAFVDGQLGRARVLNDLSAEVAGHRSKKGFSLDLLGIVLRERREQAVTVALEALRLIDHAHAVEIIQAALQVHDSSYRAHAVEVMRTLRHRKVANALARLLDDSGEEAALNSSPGTRTMNAILADCRLLNDPWLNRIADHDSSLAGVVTP